jgi:transcriptional regulator with XRE-family HTH domain
MMGRSLAALRAHLGLTQVHMADALRVGENTYVRYETGGGTPCDRVLERLLELVRSQSPEFEERFASKVEEARARRRESPYAGPPIGAQTAARARQRRQRADAAAAHRARLHAIKAAHAKVPAARSEGASKR